MLLDLRNGLVGEDDLVPHASPPLRHDGLAGEGFNGGVLRLVLLEIAERDIQRFVEDQLIIGNRPRETHGYLPARFRRYVMKANAPVAALVPTTGMILMRSEIGGTSRPFDFASGSPGTSLSALGWHRITLRKEKTR